MRINIEVVFAHTKKNNLAGCLSLYSEKYFIKNLPYIILSSLAFPAALELFLGGNNAQSDYVVNVSRSFQIPFLITYDLTISLINITSLSVFFPPLINAHVLCGQLTEVQAVLLLINSEFCLVIIFAIFPWQKLSKVEASAVICCLAPTIKTFWPPLKLHQKT